MNSSPNQGLGSEKPLELFCFFKTASTSQPEALPRHILTEIDASSGQTIKTYALSTTSTESGSSQSDDASNPATKSNRRSFRLDGISLKSASATSKDHRPTPSDHRWTLFLTNFLSSYILVIQTYLSTLFLPTGYPHTVTPDYTPYQIYDSLQAFASSIAGLLSSRAVLQSLNVVDSSTSTASTATAATLLSIVQSTLSNLTTILFASHAAPRISADVKYYRFLADIVNDAAFVLDLLAPSLPPSLPDLIRSFSEINQSWKLLLAFTVCMVCCSYAVSYYVKGVNARWWQSPSLVPWAMSVIVVGLLWLDYGSHSWLLIGHAPSPRVVALCLSSVLRAVCGVAGGSSKAVLSAHFARNNPENIGDLNAKDSSQETVIGLIGMWFGGVVVSRVEGRMATWCWMIGLLGTHLWCNWKAVRSVRLRGLNRERAGLVCKEVVEQEPGWEKRIGIEEVGEKESVLGLWSAIDTKGCRIGVTVEELFSTISRSDMLKDGFGSLSGKSEAFSELLSMFQGEKYLMWFDRDTSNASVALKKDAQAADQMKAWVHVAMMQRLTKQEARQNGYSSIKDTLSQVNRSWDELCKVLASAGWRLEMTNVEDGKGVRILIEG